MSKPYICIRVCVLYTNRLALCINVQVIFCTFMLSHPTWGEWIEIATVPMRTAAHRSHPTWGEWIEIHHSTVSPIDL